MIIDFCVLVALILCPFFGVFNIVIFFLESNLTILDIIMI